MKYVRQDYRIYMMDMTHLVNPVNPEILSKISYEIC